MHDDRERLNCDVLIVGGGPVGMLLAADLGSLGVSVVVVERNPEPLDLPRAGTIHARTVQSLLRRGLVDAEDWKGSKSPYTYGGIPSLTITTAPGEGEAVINIPQRDLEQQFETYAKTRNAHILRNRTVIDVSDNGDAITAFARGEGSEIEINARFVVGADGARSIIRQTGGFESETFGPTIAAKIAKMRLRAPEMLPQGWRMFDTGWTRVEPRADGTARVMTLDFRGPDIDRQRALTDTEFREEFQRISGVALDDGEFLFLARYSDFARLATEYSRGRMFLAGDAAHIHFPIGGQGLNLGIQDALNLGWKLAAVVKGAEPDLLDSYHDERHPVARQVIDSTQAQAILMRPGSEYEPLRNLVRDMMAEPASADVLSGTVSSQRVRYGEVGEFQANLRVDIDGRRTTLAEALTSVQPVLLLRAGDPVFARQVRPWSDRIVCAVVADPDEISCDAVLVRPDGYRAWTSRQSGDALIAVLTGWFGPA